MKKKIQHNNKDNFKVPEGYFDNFNDRLNQKLALEKTESLLRKQSKPSFKTPENYFENLESQIQDKLQKHTDVKPKIVPYFLRKK